MATKRPFTAPPGIKIPSTGTFLLDNTAASTGTTVGALVISGGVGIGGSIFVGSTISAADNIEVKSAKELRFNNSGNTFYTGLKAGANASNTTYTLPIAFPGVGTSILQSDTSGTLSWVGSIGTATTSQNINVVGAGSSNLSHSILFTPIASSSGSAVSSDTTLSFNPSTEILSVSGLAVTAATGSSNTTTGALVVTGGVGIGGSASIGGRLQMFNGANYTAFVSGATGNTTYTLPPTSPATGTSVLQSTSAGVLSWVAMTASGGLAVSGSSDGIVQFKSGSALGGTNSLFFDSTLLGLRVSGFPGGEVTAGTDAALKVEQATNSFNGSVNGTMIAVNANSGFSGDLINLQLNAITKFKVSASGAIGMSSDIVTTGIISAGDLTNSTSTTSGSLQVRGGVGITGTVFIGETLNAASSTASTSSTSGALVVTGGVGIGGNVHIGGNLVITQSTEKFLNYTTNIGSGTTIRLAVNTSGGIMYVNTGTVSGNWTLNLTGLATTNGFASSVTLIIAQGSTPYVPSTLSISGVGQTVNWQGGSLPSGNANKKDALNYSILSTGSGVTDYVIFGQLVSFG